MNNVAKNWDPSGGNKMELLAAQRLATADEQNVKTK
jgi:hypothetical protein